MKTKNYIDAIRKNICEICCDADNQGRCELSNGEICAVENYLPKIIDIVHRNNSESLEENFKFLRNEICVHCKTSDAEGKCYLRDDVNCSLDRYFPLIVETIKRVDSGKII